MAVLFCTRIYFSRDRHILSISLNTSTFFTFSSPLAIFSTGDIQLIMNIHLQWGIRRHRTHRQRPKIQYNEYTTNLLQWGFRRQRIQKSRRPCKPLTRVHFVIRTSSDALPHLVVQQLILNGYANDVTQPVLVTTSSHMLYVNFCNNQRKNSRKASLGRNEEEKLRDSETVLKQKRCANPSFSKLRGKVYPYYPE
ncbi:hypothetical protein LguiB_035173 [Lonicera macranthoides]